MDADTWTAIIVAALGSSALGAIVGGYMTTRMRGRLERAEVWRNRLLEAADDFNQGLVTALKVVGGLVPPAARGESRLRDESGALTRKTAAELRAAADLLDETTVKLARVQLLFSGDSDVWVNASRAMILLKRAVGVLQGRSLSRLLIEAVVAERDNPGAGEALLSANHEQSEATNLAILTAGATPPGAFDPADDVNLAQWARVAHHASADHAVLFIEAARAYIQKYDGP